MKQTASVIGVTLGLVAANFLYQSFSGQMWGVAVERSFFQVVAIGLTFIACSEAART